MPPRTCKHSRYYLPLTASLRILMRLNDLHPKQSAILWRWCLLQPRTSWYIVYLFHLAFCSFVCNIQWPVLNVFCGFKGFFLGTESTFWHFSYASGVGQGKAISVRICGPPLWARVKYLNNCLIDYMKFGTNVHCHSREDESQWLSWSQYFNGTTNRSNFPLV